MSDASIYVRPAFVDRPHTKIDTHSKSSRQSTSRQAFVGRMQASTKDRLVSDGAFCVRPDPPPHQQFKSSDNVQRKLQKTVALRIPRPTEPFCGKYKNCRNIFMWNFGGPCHSWSEPLWREAGRCVWARYNYGIHTSKCDKQRHSARDHLPLCVLILWSPIRATFSTVATQRVAICVTRLYNATSRGRPSSCAREFMW